MIRDYSILLLSRHFSFCSQDIRISKNLPKREAKDSISISFPLRSLCSSTNCWRTLECNPCSSKKFHIRHVTNDLKLCGKMNSQDYRDSDLNLGKNALELLKSRRRLQTSVTGTTTPSDTAPSQSIAVPVALRKGRPSYEGMRTWLNEIGHTVKLSLYEILQFNLTELG